MSSSTALFTLKTSKDGRQLISRKWTVQRGHWLRVENVDAALLRFIERMRTTRGGSARRLPSTPPPPESVPLLLPTQAELRAAGEASVAKAVTGTGGLATAARRLGLRPTRRERGAWRDFEALAEELREVARAVCAEKEEEGEKRKNGKKRGGGQGGQGGKKEEEKNTAEELLPLVMPKQAQLVAAGKGALIHSVRRHGGARAVAERAGLHYPESRSGRRPSRGCGAAARPGPVLSEL